MTLSFPLLIGAGAAEARSRMDAAMAANGITSMGAGPHLTGTPDELADAIRPYRDLGFSTVIVRMPAPYDDETIERIGELAERLAG